MIQFGEHIFQMGWNDQLDNFLVQHPKKKGTKAMHRKIFLFEGPVRWFQVVAGIGWEFITTKTPGCFSKDLVLGGEFSGFHHENIEKGNESWMTTWIWPMVLSMICALYWYHNLTSYNVSLINRFILFCTFSVSFRLHLPRGASHQFWELTHLKI